MPGIMRKGRQLTRETMSPDSRPIVHGRRFELDGLKLPPSGNYDHLIVAVNATTNSVLLRPWKGERAEAAARILMDIS